MGKILEEFSKHCKQWRYSEEVDENDFFVNATTQRAWDVWVTAWQVAIDSVVVELSYESFGVTDSEIKKALDKAGIKWTE